MVDLTSGTSWTATFTGTALVMCWGGGGGGAGGIGLTRGGGGGGGGALAFSAIPVVTGNVYPYFIGAGGAGGNYGGAAGTDGGNTIWGSNVIKAAGGKGSPAPTGGAGGAEADSIGDTRQPGTAGQAPPSGTYDGGAGGKGGGTDGGAGAPSNGQNIGLAGTAPGGGGSGGGHSTGAKGGNGGGGMIRIVQMPAVQPGYHADVANVAGTSAWTALADGIVLGWCYAGGGGARGGQALGSGGAGGGGGGYSQKAFAVTKGQSFDRIVGTGGSGSPYNASSATAGGDSSIKQGATTIVLAKGGQPGTGTTTGAGAGGSDTSGVGDVKNPGFSGQPGLSTAQYGGKGGAGALPNGGAGGAAGDGTSGGSTAGKNGTAPGGGGGGGDARTGGTGGAGALGEVGIAYFLTYGTVPVDGVEKFIVNVIHKTAAGVVKNITDHSRASGGVKVPLARCRVNLTPTLRTPPSYLPAGTTSKFDIKTGRFNWLATKLAAALAAGNCEILVVGDSIAEGWTHLDSLPPYNHTADFPNAWPRILRNKLAEHAGLVVGGTGMIRASSPPGADPQWAAGGWSTSGGHYLSSSSSGNTAVFTSILPGTAVAVMMCGTGVATVSIDGTVVGDTTAGANANAVTRRVFTGLSDGTHVVRVTPKTGTCNLLGADVYYPSTGVRVHNLAQGGATAGETGQTSWADSTGGAPARMLPTYSQTVAMLGRKPDAVIIGVGGNDLHDGQTAAQIKTAIQTIGEAFADPATDIILIPDAHGSNFFLPDSYNKCVPSWTAQMELAVAKNWSLIDFDWLTGGYDGLYPKYVGDDYGHLNTAGAKYLGDIVTKAVLG